MQRRVSAFNGYTIESPDGNAGHVSDVLFEDDDWKLRWFVIDTGLWLSDQRILIHPSALGKPDIRQRAFPVTLTKAQIEAGTALSSDPPVSGQMAQYWANYNSYGPMLGGGFYYADGLGLSASMANMGAPQGEEVLKTGDPHLRSIAEVMGYHIHALDGDIGHLEDFLVDDETWKIDFAVVNTKNWGFGTHVLVAPADIKEVVWGERYIRLEMTRYKIKSSPSWKEPDWSHSPEP